MHCGKRKVTHKSSTRIPGIVCLSLPAGLMCILRERIHRIGNVIQQFTLYLCRTSRVDADALNFVWECHHHFSYTPEASTRYLPLRVRESGASFAFFFHISVQAIFAVARTCSISVLGRRCGWTTPVSTRTPHSLSFFRLCVVLRSRIKCSQGQINIVGERLGLQGTRVLVLVDYND